MGRVPPPKNVRMLQRTALEWVADYDVFRVQRRTYASLPKKIHTYSCPDWCNVVAETTTGEILFVWQYRFGTDALSLEIPGGVIDPGESPEEAARRELREETGYEAESFELLSVVEPNPALQDNKCFTYVARNARLVGATSFDEIEELEVVALPRADLAALLDSGQVTHALVWSALETYLRRSASRT